MVKYALWFREFVWTLYDLLRTELQIIGEWLKISKDLED